MWKHKEERTRGGYGEVVAPLHQRGGNRKLFASPPLLKNLILQFTSDNCIMQALGNERRDGCRIKADEFRA